MSQKTTNTLIAIALVLIVVCLRLLPHPANFAPVAAVAIFGGAVLPRRLALWAPLAAMVASDLIIGLHNLVLLTWGCYALIALASSYIMKKPSLVRGGLLTISASVGFFLVTNFGVWLTSGMYAHTWAGFIHCYEMALPFFRNTLLSDMFYTGLLFGTFALAVRAGAKLSSSLSVKPNL